MKKRIVTLILAAAMLVSLLPTAAFAADGEDALAAANETVVTESAPIDAANCPQDETCPAAFVDTDPTAWYHDGVHYCIVNGLMNGTSDTEFEPHAPVTRAMIVTILHRLEGEPEVAATGTFTDVADGTWCAEAVEWAAANGIVEGNGDGTFEPDANITGEQAATILYRYVQYKGIDVTAGENTDILSPGDDLERCETAVLIYRLCENVPGDAPNTDTEVGQPDENAALLAELGLNAEIKDASDYTVEVNSALYSLMDFEDTSEYENATRGLIDAPEVLELKDANGNVIWSQAAYSFLDDYEQAPDTVNPILWENTVNNHAYGLFEVTEGIYQVRGYDMANLTVIEGDTGWIVFDTLMSVECSMAAMQLIEKNLGEKPIKAIVISHPHIDHYGGIYGVVSAEDVADRTLSIEEQLESGKIPIIVPEGFAEHAVSENIYAGMAMSRRSNYQFGVLLETGVTGKMGSGIGMGQSTGTVGFLMPTYEVKESGETLTIDGVEMEFQLTPGTEAPAEMNTWFPQFKALWLAENCTGTLHNLYTLRGAQVRDGSAWAGYITESITLYGDELELTFQSHNWPHWGNEVANEYMVNTAAVYKFINDQTLTYINQGYTSDEISNMIELPEALAKNWYTRQYYGTVAHNSKAVYQKYMGWYDANPANLNPLTPTDSAKKWVEYLGDVDEVLRLAKQDFDNGEYQWVAEITSTLVYADPTNEAARLLCADAMEQLGYQAESGPWRNAYLTAALELRHGNQAANAVHHTNDVSLVLEMTASMMFDYMAILLDKQAMADYDFTMNVVLPDVGEQHTLRVKNGVLLVFENTLDDDADVTITCPKNALLFLIMRSAEGISQAMHIEGNAQLLTLFVTNLNAYNFAGKSDFNIIEP